MKNSSEEVIMLKFDKASKNTASEDNSPDAKTKTHLVIADKDLKKLEVQVKESIRRSSYRV
jgi:hypothetical protein